jgi:hypothetical protein
VLVIEAGAGAVLHGSDPYATRLAAVAIPGYPPGTWDHFAYLPGMLLFGLPRALLGGHPATDARVAILLVSLLAGGLAVRLAGMPAGAAVGCGLVLFALPTGARYLTDGGDDVATVRCCCWR